MSTENAKETTDELQPSEQEQIQVENRPGEGEPGDKLEPLALFETGTLIPALIGVTSVLVLTLAAFREFGSFRQILAAALGLYLLYLFVSMMLRRKKPFVVITAEGLTFTGGKRHLPWKSIAAYEISENTLLKIHTSTVINVFLVREEIDPKKFNIFGDRRVLFLRRRFIVEMRVINLDGITPAGVIQALDKYRDAGPAEEIRRGPRMKKRKEL